MSNSSALIDHLFPATRQRALAQLLLNPGQAFHLRELARLTGINPGTLGRELDKLSQAGLVLRAEQGNQVRYQANRDCLLFEELASIFRKTHGMVPLLREALALVSDKIGVALLFGSMAKGTQSEGSDVDVLVVAEDLAFAALMHALYPAQQKLGREINPVLYTPEEFRARIDRGDAFMRRVLERPYVFLTGDKDDLAKLAGNRPATDL
jgi:predicted nucleotidyltransferase